MRRSGQLYFTGGGARYPTRLARLQWLILSLCQLALPREKTFVIVAIMKETKYEIKSSSDKTYVSAMVYLKTAQAWFDAHPYFDAH